MGAASARIGLPVMTRGMRYTRVDVTGDELVLSASLNDSRFLVPG